MRIALVALMFVALVLGVPAARAAERPRCPDFSHSKCTIDLSTGITMRYVEVGPEHGPALFLLHGYAGTSRDWELVLPRLHRLLPEYHIVVPDLRGHGDTSMPAGTGCRAAPETCFEWKQFAADNIDRLRHLSVPTFVMYDVQDFIFSPADEQTLIDSLTAAATNGGSF